MKFDGIELDMLFARLALKEIPDNMVIDGDQTSHVFLNK